MRRSLALALLPAIALSLAAGAASAQLPPLKTPQPSPYASVSQTVGLTEMTIKYSRPSVNKRKVWGELVPYGEVWRAGANENTTISFSSPVKVGGKTLQAGTYGLHMLPAQKDWTIILSSVSAAWGSYGYDQKEDALRFSVTPQPSEAMVERLSYSFDDPTENSTWVVLRWEKTKIAFKVDVDTPAVVMASMRNDLRGIPQFFWQGWNQAANYWLNHGGDLDEANRLVDKSIKIATNFQNLRTKAAIVEKKGDAKQAAELRDKAMALASEPDLNQYGYMLLQQKKVDEAISIFQQNVKAHPQSWNVYDSLAEAYQTKGDKQAAIDNYGKALSLVKDEVQKKRIEQTLGRLKSSK